MVTDATGGLALPLRNRLRVNSVAGTYGVRMCAIVEVTPYTPVYLNGYYPLYPTRTAAIRVTPSTTAQPIPVDIGALTYYLPGAAPLRCAPVAAAISGALPPTAPACVAKAGAAGRRRMARRSLLQAVSADLTSEAVQSPTVLFEQLEDSPSSVTMPQEPPPSPVEERSAVVRSSTPKESHMSGGVVAGIVVSCLAGAVILVGGVYIISRRNSQQRVVQAYVTKDRSYVGSRRQIAL